MKNFISRHLKTLILIGLLAFGFAQNSSAQFYFGKNKVQYTDFDWQVMETEHFSIYFYTEEETVAHIAARIAEDCYRLLAAKFNHEVYRSIPLIIYGSPNHFTQTNVTPSLLPESVGGFTEFLKGRVVRPYKGSYSDFYHVIRHELVHVFQISKLESIMTRQRVVRMAMPPLWFIEGQAEFWSTEWDSEADAILKDMVLSGNIIPIERMYIISGTYFMYKVGQSICQFINDEYGSDKLVLIYENWWKGRDFDQILELTLGEPVKEVSKRWEYYLKKKYFPEIADQGLAKMEAKQLTRSGYALKGVPIKITDGNGGSEDWIVFKANKMGYSGIYLMPPSGEKRELYTLVKGERSSSFESLHLLQSGIDANNNGLVVFSSKSKESDVLYLYDIDRRDIVEKYELPSLSTILSPRFSPDNNRVVFSGSDEGGQNDLYVLNINTGKLEQITNDIYKDGDPAFNLNGDSIIFSSDRCLNGNHGARNLYQVSVGGGDPVQLTYGTWRDQSPDVSEQGIYFSSDRDGSFNIYRLNPDQSINKITSLLTGAYDPRLTTDGTGVIFSGYQDFGFHIYRAELQDSLHFAAGEIPDTRGQVFWKPGRLAAASYKSSVKYNTDYSFDIAQSAISYDPVYGTIGGLQMAMSDMLGDHTFYFVLANTAQNKDEILTSFNVAVTYINKINRLNWGLGGYHLYDEYYNDYDGYYFERQVGGLVYLNYPFSKYNRVETTTYLRYSDKDYTFGFTRRRATLWSSYISLVSDNSLWDISGPLDGHRYNFTFGVTSALDKGRTLNRIGLVDIRHYFRLGRYSAFANRMFIYSSSGEEPQRLYFGGSWSFRGYDRRDFYVRNIVFASNELRFPLIDNLSIGFPFGGIGFQAIRGALFFDVGRITNRRFHLLDQTFFDDLIGSFGAGFRVALGGLIVFRFDFARTTDFNKISDRTDFDFFFGWNF